MGRRSSAGRAAALCFTLAGLMLIVGAPRAGAEGGYELEPITVTATRISEDVDVVPLSVTVIGGEELRARGATDLRSALALAPGIDVAPGSDGGPASSNPEVWGLKEVDAYLLVVDGVPWGGAFNPNSTSVDLHDVERIEVIRGAAPVMYGATSFSGVIHVIHKRPGDVERSATVSGGSFGSGGASASIPLASSGAFTHAIEVDGQRRGFSGMRSGYDLVHARWSAEWRLDAGLLKLGADGSMLRQSPDSPQPRDGQFLGAPVPIDSNQNPLDAYLDQDRATFTAGFDHPLASGAWDTLLSVSNTDQRTLRGFLDPTELAPNDAHGFREAVNMLDVYFDTHLSLTPAENWKWVSGADYMLGRGSAKGGDFDYQVSLDGVLSPGGASLPPAADIHVEDQRDFAGAYTFAEWRPSPRWLLEAGARINHTGEGRQTSTLTFPPGPGQFVSDSDRRDQWRASGSAGATFTAWTRDADSLRFYGDYRDTYKPAAVDFGLDSVAQILAPETARSFEAGAKSRWFDDRLDVDVSIFQMDFQNLVVSNSLSGLPTLQNAGRERFRGVEAGLGGRVEGDWRWLASYSLHDARFTDYVTDIGGTPTQLAGNRLITSARNMASAGFMRRPRAGWIVSAQANYVGSRFLDQQNTDLAPAYVTWSAGVGYRTQAWEARVDGSNLNDQRPPVSASELGDSQYYLLPARRVDAQVSYKF